ncbi:MAG TPA: cyclic nucleotide-binding domain-containing protein [Kofleriaceae bacterium]|nr:cyclic nucleotide-binding domain-containing protein [Kofleriaceae bacterium]
MELSFAAATDVGRQRTHNEDNFLIDKKLRLFMVADGMGGHAAGEIASSIAVHEIRDAVNAKRDIIERYRVDNPAVQPYEILQILENAVSAACAAIHARAQAEPEKRGMGTTSTVLLIAGHGDHLRGFIAHVGDSRVYLSRKAESHILTEDHSLINELIKKGKLERGDTESANYRKYKNAVTRAVGIYNSVAVDTIDFDILPGDALMLCSDGLHAYLTPEELPALLAEGEVKEAPKRLIELANRGGGHDNITSIVVRIGPSATRIDAPENQTTVASLKLEVLKGSQLFKYLSYKELVRVSNITSAIVAQPGQVLFTEGQPGQSMYIVIAGSVRLCKGAATVTELGVGEHFGEMSLVDRAARSLTAIAGDSTRLLEIERKDFFEIVRREPQAAVKMLWSLVSVLGTRLRKTTNELGEALNDRDANDTVADVLFGE